MHLPVIGSLPIGCCVELESHDMSAQRLLLCHLASQLLSQNALVFWIDCDFKFDIALFSAIARNKSDLERLKVAHGTTAYKLDLFLQFILQRANQEEANRTVLILDSYTDLVEKESDVRNFDENLGAAGRHSGSTFLHRPISAISYESEPLDWPSRRNVTSRNFDLGPVRRLKLCALRVFEQSLRSASPNRERFSTRRLTDRAKFSRSSRLPAKRATAGSSIRARRRSTSDSRHLPLKSLHLTFLYDQSHAAIETHF